MGRVWYVQSPCSVPVYQDRQLTDQMDIGVGSFVFSLGIISTRSFHVDMSLPRFLLRNVKKSIPVIALGMVRVIMVKGVEYPVGFVV